MNEADNTLLTAPIFYGFTMLPNNHDLIKNPINTVFNGMILGSIYGFGTKLIATNMNDNQKYLFSGLVAISGCYYIYKRLTD